MKIFVLTLIAVLSLMGFAFALDCPNPPEQVKKDWEVEVNAAVAKIGPVKGPELRAKTKQITKDLLGKLPGADKLYLEQMMFSAYCSALRDDSSIRESQKAILLKEYRKEVMTVIKSPSQKSNKPKSAKATGKQPELQMPRFSEEVRKFYFSLGGMGSGYSKELLKDPKEPFVFGDYKPIKLYLKNNMLFADVKVYGGAKIPSIEIKENKVHNMPPSWDLNANDKALELVNENQTPIYQFYYKTPSHIVVNGIFPFSGGLVLATDGHTVVNPIIPIDFKLKRIFRYPSWKYPGQYE